MSTVWEWESGAIALGPAVVALGVFDGVHVGHQALITDTVERARNLGVISCVMTFDRDPDQVLTPERAAPQLLTIGDKLAAIEELGVEALVVVPFCRLVAEMAPDRFVSDVLVDALQPVEVLVGRDFRFGRYASGNVAILERYGTSHGFAVVAHDLVCVAGEPVTSTRVRGLIAEGNVTAARALLGRPHRVRGSVVHGRAAGRALGVPTANVTPVAFSALPADGVYAGRVIVGDHTYLAGISVGTPPTFPEARDYLEAHLVDFEGDLYGEDIVIEFVERLRAQRAFGTGEELAEAIHADLRDAVDAIDEADTAEPVESGPCDG